MNRNYFRSLLSVCLIATVVNNLAAFDDVKRLEEFADAYHRWGLFQGTVLVAKNDDILFQKAYGMSSVESKTPNSVDTVYPIASLSKQFTAAALLILQERGVLDFDKKVAEYVPELKESIGSKISIRQILQHRAGLRRDIFTGTKLDPHADYSVDELISQINLTELQSKPGRKHSYSNLGYTILAAVLENVTGKSYGEAMRELVFQPLEMSRTGHANNISEIKGAATGYATLVDQMHKVPQTGISATIGGGSLFSTVGDLHRWAKELMNPTVLSKRSVTQLRLGGFGVVSYPYSWPDRKKSERQGRAIYHGGTNDGFATVLTIYLDHGLTVVALSNNQPSWTNDLYNQLINIPLGFEESPPRRNIARDMYATLYAQGIDEAEAIWQKSKSDNAPDTPNRTTMNRIGYLFIAFGRFDEAIQAFELFTRVEPTNANAWDSYGEALAQGGRTADAIHAYEKSLKLNPTNGGAVAMLKMLRSDALKNSNQ